MPSTFQTKLCATALAEVGVHESPKNSNFGPRVNQFKAATNLPATEAWAWCAAFICFVVRDTLAACGVKLTKGFVRPTTAGAWDFINWSKAQDDRTTTLMSPRAKDIQAGDIVVFKFSHIGLAVSGADAGGTFWTCEGNTDLAGSREGGGVYKRTRNICNVKARIRINL
jgi:hypothetical protein